MIYNLLRLLSPREKKRALFVLLILVFSSLVEALGVASIMPFVAVLANPNLIETNIFLNYAYEVMLDNGIENKNNFIAMLGLCVFVILIFSLAIKSLATFFQLRFVFLQEYFIGKFLVETYLHQDYSWFLDQNSTSLGKNILSEVNAIVVNALLPLMVLVAQGAVCLSLFVLLQIKNFGS